ncbi:hypothetical protein, partial [Rodentibacter rarus]
MNKISNKIHKINKFADNVDLSQKIGQVEKILHLSQSTLTKGSQLAVQLSSGNVLGAVSELLGLSSPTGLQFTLETVTFPPSTFS